MRSRQLVCLLPSLLAAAFGSLSCSSGPPFADDSASASSDLASGAFHPEWHGLLASPALDAQPVKGIYFFPGEASTTTSGPEPWKACNYTAHPTDTDDLFPTTRSTVVNRMLATNANVIVMSYWGDAAQDSPLKVDPTSLSGVLDAAAGKAVAILPAIESATGYEFADDFPTDGSGQTAPKLLARIDGLMALFAGRMGEWAQMYDLYGAPRYAINLLHVRSSQPVDAATFAQGFDNVAYAVWKKYGVWVGFTLDVIPLQGGFVATPQTAGQELGRTASVLAIQRFNSPVFNDVNSGQCTHPRSEGTCGVCPCAPKDNNKDASLFDDLVAAANAARSWVGQVPVIGDVSPGFDGRLVWCWAPQGAAFYGDNEGDIHNRNAGANVDAWRNSMSMLKGGGIVGATFDTWNGYTEGYAAVPTVEHGNTDLNWLTDFFSADPRICDHIQYQNGSAIHHVYGAICDRWGQLGAYQGVLGAPLTSEEASPGQRGRIVRFTGGAVLWSATLGAHAVWGLIGAAYANVHYDQSCLGLPTSEEESWGSNGGRVVTFEGGTITWTQGATQATVRPAGPCK